MKAEDVFRRHGISTATLFNWRKKYAGMEAQQLKLVSWLASSFPSVPRLLSE